MEVVMEVLGELSYNYIELFNLGGIANV